MSVKLDIIVITYNSAQYIEECLESIKKTASELNPGIIVVDNASEDNTVDLVEKKYPEILAVKSDENLGYAAAINLGVSKSYAEALIISNPDVIYQEGAISNLLDTIEKNDEVGVAGPQQVFRDGSWQNSYSDFPGFRLGFLELFFVKSFQRGLRAKFWKKLPIDRFTKDVDYVDGAVMAVRREVFEKIGGFDEDYFLFTEETDFCYRLKKTGFVVIFQPNAKVIHFRGGTDEQFSANEKIAGFLIESKILFCRKHYSPFHTRAYIRLEYMQTGLKIIFYKIIRNLKSSKNKTKTDLKLSALNVIRNQWRKLIR